MKCHKCNVNIESRTRICPLCKNELTDISDNKDYIEDDAFPVIPTIHKGHGLFLKILALIFVASTIICFVIDLITTKKISWSFIVLAANACVALSIAMAMRKRHNFARLVFSEYILIVIGSILWDYFTGWNRWSLNYVLPLVNMVYIYITFVIRLGFPYQLRNYFMNLVLACVIGIVPVILLILDITNVSWTAYACAITSVLMFSSLIVFDAKKIKKELESRFHV